MAIVLVLARCYRPLPNPSMAGFGCCLCFASVSSWKCISSAVFSSASSRRISAEFDPGSNHPEKLKQLWEDLFLNHSQWWDNRLDKRNSSDPDFWHRSTRESLWLSNQLKPMWVDSCLVTLDTQPQNGLQGSPTPAGELQKLCEGGHLDRALDVMLRMNQQGFVPSAHMYRSLLKACARRKALVQARQVYWHLAQYGLETTEFLGEYVVSTLVKCGGLEVALTLFHRLRHRTSYSWTALISGYTASGKGREALKMYQVMQEQSVQPTTFTFVSLIKACASIADVEEGKRIHAEAIKHRCESDLFVRTCLVDMYSKCGYIAGAQNVFDELSQRDVVSWNVMLAAYAQQGEGLKALQLYDQMRTEGVSPDDRTFVSVLQACGIQAEKEEDILVDRQATKLKYLETGKRVHVDACSKGYDSDVFVGNTLISMYGKCGSILDAQYVFEGLLHRDVVSWNAMLTAYAQQGQAEKAWHVYVQMQEECVIPDDRTFVSVLQGCGMLAEHEEQTFVEGQFIKIMALGKVKTVHADIQNHGYESSVYVGNTLVSMYGKCGSILDAHNVFHGLFQRSLVSWNGMLAAYAQQSQAERALQLYEQMQEDSVSADVWTFVSILQALGVLAEKEEPIVVDGRSIKVKCLRMGKAIQSCAGMKGYNSDVFVGSTLISLYAKCGSILDTQNVFDRIVEQNVVSWNAMLAAYCQHGQADKVLQMYELMQETGVSPNDRTLVSVLQACSVLADDEEHDTVDGQSTKTKSLEKGKVFHADAWRKGYDSDVFVSNTLVSMYGKCGSLVDAENTFDGLSKRSVVAWTALLAAYAQQGQAEKSLELYEHMLSDGVSPDAWTFVSVLQGCGILAEGEEDVIVDCAAIKLTSLGQGKAIYSYAQRKGYDSDVFVGNSMVSMYGKCGSVIDALHVFNALSQQTVAGWTAILAAHAQQGQVQKALKLYEQMSEDSVSPNDRTFVTLLQAIGMLAENEGSLGDGPTAKMKLLEKVKTVYADAWRKGYGSDVFMCNTLVSVYAKCGSIPDARKVFDGLSKRDVVSWNGMVTACAQQGQAEEALQLYEKMMEEGVSPNDRSFVSVFQACTLLADEEGDVILDGQSMKIKCLEMGKVVHAGARIRGYDSDLFVGNTLVCLYGKCGSIGDAQMVFDGLLKRNVVSWNSMLAAHVQQNEAEEALKLYGQMQQEAASPDNRTFVSVLQACGILAEEGMDGSSTEVKVHDVGRLIHADACKKGYDTDVFVGNTLISMYGKCRNIVDAENVFAGLSQPNVVSWNAMLAAYVQQDQAEKALQLYKQMQMEPVSPDDRTFVSVLQACGILAEKGDDVDGQWTRVKCLKEGNAVHVDAWNKGYQSDVFVSSTLISMYGKCGSVMDAKDVFDGLSERGLVAWNALLSAYLEQGDGEKTLQLYRQMQKNGVRPDAITLACVLQACSYTGSLDVCREIHSTLLSSGNELSLLLGNTLIHAYGRCASVVDAQIVFDALLQPNVASWNALLAAHARQGDCSASLECYEKMQLAGVKPDGVTFLSVLYACSHAGLVDKGVEFFESMSRVHGVTPEIGHYVSIVDLLGRAGHFTMVQHFLSTMPQKPDLAMWLCVLGACRKHGKVVLGRRSFDCAVRLDPQHSAAYVLMLNIYADAGLWDRAKEVKELRQKTGAWKKPGQSWIDHEQEVCTFVAGNQGHPQDARLYCLLGELSLDLKDDWHLPRVQNHALNSEEKAMESLILTI